MTHQKELRLAKSRLARAQGDRLASPVMKGS